MYSLFIKYFENTSFGFLLVGERGEGRVYKACTASEIVRKAILLYFYI